MDSTNPFDAPSEDDLPDFVQDAPPAPAPEPAEEAPAQEIAEPLYPGLQETPQEEAPAEEPAVEAPKAWAGKYQSPEELEKGYRELRELQRRTAERAKAYEQRGLEVEVRARQYEEALRRAAPYVQQATELMRRQQQQQQDPYGEPAPQPQITPEMLIPLVQQQAAQAADQRLAQYQWYQQAEQQKQLEYAEAAQNFQGFFESHPDVVPGSPLDQDIAATIQALNEAWAPTGSEVDISSSIALEVAYEAAKRPALRRVLEMNPSYIDTEEGRILARKLASELDGITQEPAASTGRNIAPRPHTPVVERGSSQAPQPGTPLDEFDQAVSEYRKAKTAHGSEVFFGS